MIFFYCTECKEELEAEDSIRGARMKCPACFKDIEVPQVGVRVPTSRSERKKSESHHGETTDRIERAPPGSKFILIVLLAGFVGLLILAGIGYTLHKQAQERAARNRPRCEACSAKGTVTCAICAGNKKQPCKECNGSGKRKNFREEEEVCFRCNGSGRLDCVICGGRGEYGCNTCAGTGFLVPPPK